MVKLQLRQLGIPPGHRVLFPILEELGDKRPSRLI